jgi:hypothetical protein
LSGDRVSDTSDSNSTGWAEGPKFVWRNLAAPKASDETKSSPLSRAWKRTACWLRALRDSRSVKLASAARWKLLNYDHQLNVADPAMLGEAAAFRVWRALLNEQVLAAKPWVQSFLAVADKEAERAADRAARAATDRFAKWLADGPANGLKRQHLFSRSVSGWVADQAGGQQHTTLSELDDLEGISQSQLQAALMPDPSADTPVGAQQVANVERAKWGIQWASECKPDELDWPGETEQLEPISIRQFREVLFSFPAGTGLGWDGIHPRALLRLPDGILAQWLSFLLKCEREGRWPQSVGVVVVVLLPKNDGGFRPIGLIPNAPRVWMRLRRPVAKKWEIACDRKYLYAGAGRGSTVAAWKQSARGEAAAATGVQYAQVLLDLVKAFERIPYRVLLREAVRLGYPMRMIRLAIATYRMPRVIRVGTSYSDTIVAIRGIVAGSGLATTEMRLCMIDCVDSALRAHPTIEPTLFVDDLSGERDGSHKIIVKELGGFIEKVAKRVHDDDMELSQTKSVVTASNPQLGAEMVERLRPQAIKHMLRVKSLGVGMAAGVRRNAGVLKDRLTQFKGRLPRFRALRVVGVDTARIMRTGGVAALTHGEGSLGVAPSMLLEQRRAVNAASAPQGGLGGQELEFAMMLADGSKKGRADPAFEAHTSVALHWAQAIWNEWIPVATLQASVDYAEARIRDAANPWSVVAGPAAALVCSLDRLGWRVVSATELETDDGKTLDLRVTPPIVVKREVEEAVQRWRWRNVGTAHPSLHGVGCDFEPIFKLLNSKRNDATWNPELRSMLKSVVANRQFTQSRCFQCGWVKHPKCLFCLHAAAGGTPVSAKITTKQSKADGGTTAPHTTRGPDIGAKESLHTRATPEQIEATPNGTLAHRNYQCPSLRDEREMHAPSAMRLRAEQLATGNLAFERALRPSIAHKVPPPGQGGNLRVACLPSWRHVPRESLHRWVKVGWAIEAASAQWMGIRGPEQRQYHHCSGVGCAPRVGRRYTWHRSLGLGEGGEPR